MQTKTFPDYITDKTSSATPDYLVGIEGGETVKMPLPTGLNGAGLLGSKTVNMNTLADQIITLSGGTKFVVSDIVITNASISLTTAGGVNFTTAANQGGDYVAYGNVTQVGSNSPLVVLTNSTRAIMTTRVAQDTTPAGDGLYMFLTNPVMGTSLYFSLYVAQGAAATADVYVYGYVIE